MTAEAMIVPSREPKCTVARLTRLQSSSDVTIGLCFTKHSSRDHDNATATFPYSDLWKEAGSRDNVNVGFVAAPK